MAKPKVVVALLTKDQDYQVMQAADADRAATRAGFDLEIVWAKNNGRLQIEQLYHFVRALEKDRPIAMLVQTVLGDGLPVVAKDAVNAGIGWILLNRDGKYIDSLRAESPRIPVGAVTIDQDEIGRIQGRQLRKLLPKGGNVLYVQGPPDSAAAQLRLDATRATLGGASIDIDVIKGEWTEESGEKAVSSWLFRPGTKELHVIAAQNDAMAIGAQRAIAAKKPQWAALPVVGCDGLPKGGQQLVNEKKFAATIVIPPVAGAALDLIVNHQQKGAIPPARTIMAPRAYPAV